MSAARLKALKTLKRLQTLEADRAKSYLAECLQEEEGIKREIRRIEGNIEENKIFAFEGGGDEMRRLDLQNSYREWLPLARKVIEEKHEELKEAERRTEKAREGMVKVNTALEATEKMIEELNKEIEQERQRKEQAEIDDMARTTFLRRRSEEKLF